MPIFQTSSSFSMRSTDFFFADIDDLDPSFASRVNVFTGGLPEITNFFSINKEGVSRIDIAGEFFFNALGQRDGTIRAMRFGELIDDDEGNATEIIEIDLSITGLSADRSRFDDLVFAGNTLGIFGLLGSGDDNISGSFQADELFGFRGDDTMFGGGGNDLLKGGGGDDFIRGAVGADNVNGGTGDDIVRGNGGFDTVIGGSGEDKLFGGGGQDIVRGGAGDDTINGNGGADRILGGSGDDIAIGGRGADNINGGGGDDTIDGGNGTDTIIGGDGDDRLTGGARADIFVFASADGDDIVTDYEDNLDKIQIEGGLAFVDIDIDQDGANAIISFGAATITLLGQDATELTETDFLF